MNSEIAELTREVRQTRTAICVLALLVICLVFMGAQANPPVEVKASAVVLVDKDGNEIGRWDAEGLRLTSLTLGDSTTKSAMLTKEGFKLNRLAIVDATGKEYARFDADNGEPRLGLKDSNGTMKLSMSIANGEPILALTGEAQGQDSHGIVASILGEFPFLTIRDPRSAAQFGGTVRNPNTGNNQSKPSGRLALYFDGRQYWSTPAPQQSH